MGCWPLTTPPHDERISELYDRLLSKANVRSIMYVAIRVGDEVPAAFVLSTTRQARQWTTADSILARSVADQTGIAIRQAQLYQKASATSVREALANRLSLAIRASSESARSAAYGHTRTRSRAGRLACSPAPITIRRTLSRLPNSNTSRLVAAATRSIELSYDDRDRATPAE